MDSNQNQTKKILEEIQRPLNTRATTARWLDNQPSDVAHDRVREIIIHNLASVKAQLEYIMSLDISESRMLRLSSDLLPFYTHPKWRCIYTPTVLEYAKLQFASIGDYAREHDIRLSFHPGQFVCIVSDRPDVVDRSIEELEYHADMIRMMGYGKTFQDFKCNVHLSGRLGVDGFADAYSKMSTELKNTLTIENDEYVGDINTVLQISNYVPVVLDIHHHFINSGQYIKPSDDLAKRVVDSWRGIRPVIHYSLCREQLISKDVGIDKPKMDDLLLASHKKAKLRAHSDFMWHENSNRWALSFLETSDIMVEAKMKNLASLDLIRFYKSMTV
jgi:UV damage endonuclease UvdE